MFLAIVPAYNEAQRVGSVVRSLFDHVDAVVVVDDGSTDTTAQVARDAGATVLVHELNRGQGAALETGQSYARAVGAHYVLHFDADGQLHPGDIVPALAALKEHDADILFGSRSLDDRSNVPLIKRHLIHPLGRLVNRVVAGVSLTDAHNGFRILTKHALDHIRLSQDRMAHATEIVALTQKAELRYIEFPVQVTYHEFGQGIGSGFHILKDLFADKFLR